MVSTLVTRYDVIYALQMAAPIEFCKNCHKGNMIPPQTPGGRCDYRLALLGEYMRIWPSMHQYTHRVHTDSWAHVGHWTYICDIAAWMLRNWIHHWETLHQITHALPDFVRVVQVIWTSFIWIQKNCSWLDSHSRATSLDPQLSCSDLVSSAQVLDCTSFHAIINQVLNTGFLWCSEAHM